MSSNTLIESSIEFFFSIEVVDDGTKAVDVASKKQFDLILMDMMVLFVENNIVLPVDRCHK